MIPVEGSKVRLTPSNMQHSTVPDSELVNNVHCPQLYTTKSGKTVRGLLRKVGKAVQDKLKLYHVWFVRVCIHTYRVNLWTYLKSLVSKTISHMIPYLRKRVLGGTRGNHDYSQMNVLIVGMRNYIFF